MKGILNGGGAALAALAAPLPNSTPDSAALTVAFVTAFFAFDICSLASKINCLANNICFATNNALPTLLSAPANNTALSNVFSLVALLAASIFSSSANSFFF